MKLFLTLLVFAPTFAFAASLTCGDVQLLDYDTNGNPIFKASGTNVEIRADAAGLRGWIAEFNTSGKIEVQTDVELSMIAISDLDIADLIAVTRPDINFADIVNVQVGNIGVQANLEDGAGMTIFSLLDAQGGELGKVMQIGWGAGRCTN